MEPILQNPQFTKLLRVWEFITAYYEYLEIPQTFSQLSLYELSKQIQHEKHMTSFISQIIEALVRKAGGHQKTSKNNSTILFLAKNNKFNFFNDLAKSSFYQLGLSQVNFSLSWRDLHEINAALPFQALSIEEKYRYLIGLINLVSLSAQFKNQYLEKVKKQYEEALKNSADKAHIHANYAPKLGPSVVLGKDLSNNCYFYFSKIHDSIFAFNFTKNQWKKITGQQNIKKEVVSKLLQKPNLLTQYQLDLLENIQLLWNKLDLPIQSSVFDKKKEIFDFKPTNIHEDKLDKIKFKMCELDEQYSRFIGDCYNFRWATKKDRIAFRNQVNEAKQMMDVASSLSFFFHKTKHTIQKKLNTLDVYDYNLQTDDQPETEFKNMFLRMNYLYVKDVFAENESSKSHSVNLYHHIKGFLELSQAFQPYLYEYLTTFVESMLGIIKQMYPGAIEKRGKMLEKLKEQQKEKEIQADQKGKGTKNKLRKNVMAPSQDSSQQQEEQSSTTADKNQSIALNGRRLRQKARINYKIKPIQPISISKSLSKVKAKKYGVKSRNQPIRNAKGKQSKMVLDSDSDEDQVDISLSESDTEKDDKGLSLDKFKYVEDDDDTQKFRRSLRNSKGRS